MSHLPFQHPTQQPIPPTRWRSIYLIFAILIVTAGLLLRSPLVTLPAWIVKYGGDSLWALVVFLAVGWILRRSPTILVACFAFTIAVAIECSQLYHAPWIDYLRSLPIGRLLLGSTFNGPDMLAYAVGIGFGAWIEHMAQRTRSQSEDIER